MRFVIVLAILTIPSIAQPMPSEMREVLTSEFSFSPADLARVESGKAVARMVPTGRPDDLRMAGAILMHVSSSDFIRAFRDVEHFAAGKEVRQTGRFSVPPVEADYASYHLSDLNKDEINSCRPGHCSYKMPAQAMEALKTNIDWNAPDWNVRAEAYIHKLLIERLLDYQREGDKALAVYYDTPAPYSVAEGLHSLLGQEARLQNTFPDLVRYAAQYPNSKPPDTDNFFYWQDAAFGLKHVLRVQHVIITKVPRPSADPHYAIISKMLFATHYFRAAVEFNYVYPVRTANGEPAIYFVAMQRSYVDGLTGVKGGILRRIAENRSPATLAANLELARQKLESHP